MPTASSQVYSRYMPQCSWLESTRSTTELWQYRRYWPS